MTLKNKLLWSALYTVTGVVGAWICMFILTSLFGASVRAVWQWTWPFVLPVAGASFVTNYFYFFGGPEPKEPLGRIRRILTGANDNGR